MGAKKLKQNKTLDVSDRDINIVVDWVNGEQSTINSIRVPMRFKSCPNHLFRGFSLDKESFTKFKTTGLKPRGLISVESWSTSCSTARRFASDSDGDHRIICIYEPDQDEVILNVLDFFNDPAILKRADQLSPFKMKFVRSVVHDCEENEVILARKHALTKKNLV